MVSIRFTNDDAKRKALEQLPGRFSFTTHATGAMDVDESALVYLASERIDFTITEIYVGGKPTPSKARVTVADLERASSLDESSCFDLFLRYSKQKSSVDAVPSLRRGLLHNYHAVRKCSAKSLQKLGPAAKQAIPELLKSAEILDDADGLPQSYPECVDAIAAINPADPALLPLIERNLGHDNWIPFSASLRALKKINTPQSLELLKRTTASWQSNLNKTQRRIVAELLAD